MREDRLQIKTKLGILTETINGNLDKKTSQGALVRILEHKNKNKYIIKFARKTSGYNRLLHQIKRMQILQNSGVDITPKLLESSVNKSQAYYIMPFIKGVSGYQRYVKGIKTEIEFKNRFNDLITQLNSRLWSKGKFFYEKRYFSTRQNYVVDRSMKDIEEFIKIYPLFIQNKLIINGVTIPSLKTLLLQIKSALTFLDDLFKNTKIPRFTHGDLHLDNILVQANGEITIIDLNENEQRENNSIEFELGRLIMSFYREIIASKHYEITIENVNDFRIKLNGNGLKILNLRFKAYEEIFQNKNLMFWFADREKSRKIIEFMEALHLVNVFFRRPEPEIIPTYVLGTLLLSKSLNNLKLLR